MTVTLDQIVSVGSLQIAALTDCAVNVIRSNGVVFFTGRKHPVAILIRQDGALSAFRPDGDPMTREQVDELCPNAWQTALSARGSR
jgi:hypothetical protein